MNIKKLLVGGGVLAGVAGATPEDGVDSTSPPPENLDGWFTVDEDGNVTSAG